MFKITTTVDGKPCSPENFASAFTDSIERHMIAAVRQNLETRLGNKICATHGNHAELVMEGTKVKEMDIKVKGCCQEFIDSISESLRGN